MGTGYPSGRRIGLILRRLRRLWRRLIVGILLRIGRRRRLIILLGIRRRRRRRFRFFIRRGLGIVVLVGRRIKRYPAETLEVHLCPCMRVIPRNIGKPIGRGLRQEPFHITGRHPRDAAHHRHRRREICTVSFGLSIKEIRHKSRLSGGVSGVSEYR